MRRRLAALPRAELIAYCVLIAVALLLRLYDLGDRPFHHDESQDAYFSWTFYDHGDYTYMPLLHGPVRFYLTAVVYTLFGDSDFTARLAPALMGTAIVALPALLRAQLGRIGAFTAAVILATGPSFLYFSRFAREDIYITCIDLALFVAVFRFAALPRRWHPALIAGALALAFATKESTFITCAIAGPFLLAWFLLAPRGDLRRAVTGVGWEAWGWALAVFVLVQTLLFTTFLTEPQHWQGLWEGLSYWAGQQDVRRGGEIWYFYGVVLLAHEWPAVLLGAVGIGVALARPTPVRLFLVWAFAATFAAYAYAGEKFAWLVLQPLLPLLLLAGIGVEAVWYARRRWYGWLGIAATVLGVAYMGYASFLANALHRADPREFLVSTQTSEDVLGVRDRVLREAAVRGPGATVTIDASEGATFPYAWYLRHLRGVGYPDLAGAAKVPTSDIVLMTEPDHTRLASALQGYEQRRFRFRVWWVRDYGLTTDPSRWWKWYADRTPWNATGGMPEWLLIRRRR